jgi:hypothetical protein
MYGYDGYDQVEESSLIHSRDLLVIDQHGVRLTAEK